MGFRRAIGGSPRVICLVLAMVPVAMLTLLVVNLAINSMPAIETFRFEILFSNRFISPLSGGGQRWYGMLPAIWGTLLVAVVAMGLALPVSLAAAVLSSELSPGFLGRALGTAMGVLSGIPPIVYALLSVVFAESFMVPKFCGQGIPPEEIGRLPGLTWYDPGMLPLEQSTLLAGILLALLVIPFMAPLLHDAMRNVPDEQREASLALGADRWFTLKRVVVPSALPGIVSAASLGALKAMGDVMIAIWAIGYVSSSSGTPNPLWDVLERVATLTSTGAGLAGGTGAARFTYNVDPRRSVAFFAGLLLLAMALAILSLVSLLQKRLQKRLAS
jgi:phosphate transport system permease protein